VDRCRARRPCHGLARGPLRRRGAIQVRSSSARGGYHHHLGTNVWAGPGARPPAEHDARLLEWTIEVPTADDVVNVARSITESGHAVEQLPDAEVRTRDPWGSAIRLRAASAAERT
jgi:catechol-2,3-dioxygenase